jgi:membrane-associated protein
LKRISEILLAFEVWYVSLLFLSIVFIIPRYLSGDVTGGFVSLLRHSLVNEPEWQVVINFLAPVAWVIIPLSSIILAAFSWLCWNISFRTKVLNELTEASATVLFLGSLVPSLLTLRELMLYRLPVVGALSIVLGSLNSLAYVTRNLLDPHFIAAWGIIGVGGVIFVETGFFFGFFLPGDSLLVTIGILASVGVVNLGQVIPVAALAAVAGDQVNYFIGRRSGDALSRRFGFVARHMTEAKNFYDKHGGTAIVIARFLPVVRTFAPAAAGASGMGYRAFLTANVVGGVGWVIIVTLAGFLLGRILPVALVSNLALIVAIVVLVSLLPPVLASARKKSQKDENPWTEHGRRTDKINFKPCGNLQRPRMRRRSYTPPDHP